MTLNEMAAAIRNNLSNGLKEVDDFTYSLAQIREEIGTTRNRMIMEMSQKGNLNPNQFVQRMLNVPISYSSFPATGHTTENNVVPHVKMRRLANTVDNTSLTYIGPPDMSLNFKKYFDQSFDSHRYSRVVKNRPYVFVDMAHDADGFHDVYIFNLNTIGISEISIYGVFADPIAILDSDGILGDDEEFPCPTAVQSQIIDSITDRYVRYYKQLNHPYQPNTNTDQK